MSLLYVDENNAKVGFESNQIYLLKGETEKQVLPVESIESLTITGNAQVTTKCLQECLRRGVPVFYFSKTGSYLGSVQSLLHCNTKRQRLQTELYQTEFALELAKKILYAKMKNQLVLLRRYEKGKYGQPIDKQKSMLQICISKLNTCNSISEVIGYEGQGAKAYFDGLSMLIHPDFAFHGRNKRPPKDPFNSMLSFGYTILLTEVYSKIISKSMNPFFGFIHQDKTNHPSLASDLMEEWRSVLVDSIVLGMINGNEVSGKEFSFQEEYGCIMSRECISRLVSKLERKLSAKTKYLEDVDYEVSFRYAMILQLDSLVEAMEYKDAALYKPVIIR